MTRANNVCILNLIYKVGVKVIHNKMVNSRKFFLLLLILASALVIDQILARSDLYNLKINYYERILVFSSITGLSLTLQYFILLYALSIFKLAGNNRFVNVTVIVTQSIVTIIMTTILVQVMSIFTSSYKYSELFGSIGIISYSLAIVLLALLSYKFFRFYNTKLNVRRVVYGLVFCTFMANAILNWILINLSYQNFLILPFRVTEHCVHLQVPPSCIGIELSLTTIWFGSFLTLWCVLYFSYPRIQKCYM